MIVNTVHKNEETVDFSVLLTASILIVARSSQGNKKTHVFPKEEHYSERAGHAIGFGSKGTIRVLTNSVLSESKLWNLNNHTDLWDNVLWETFS